MAKTNLTAARLREVLDYNPDTGVFTWKVALSSRATVGKTAGGMSGAYASIRISGASFLSHRLAWLYVYGSFPDGDIDHINRNRLDNRICNLRIASPSENAQNRSKQYNNSSGYVGVNWDKLTRKWRAQIKHQGGYTHLGLFTEIEAAASAYAEAKKKLHAFNPAVVV